MLLALLLALTIPTLDGVLTENEWTGARREPLDGGGEVLLLERGDMLYVAIDAPRRGIASLCTGTANRVEILHASAALGTAIYEKRDARWVRTQEFAYVVRENATAAQRDEHLTQWGWLANPSARGNQVREFAIKRNRKFLGIVWMNIGDPPSLAVWPKSIADDCKAERLVSGWPDETFTFDPRTWHSLAAQ